jgi:hypothetical protein
MCDLAGISFQDHVEAGKAWKIRLKETVFGITPVQFGEAFDFQDHVYAREAWKVSSDVYEAFFDLWHRFDFRGLCQSNKTWEIRAVACII